MATEAKATEPEGEKITRHRTVMLRRRIEVFAHEDVKLPEMDLEAVFAPVADHYNMVLTIGPRMGNARTGGKPDPITTQVRIAPANAVRVGGTRIPAERLAAIENDAKAKAAAKAAGFSTVSEFVTYLTGNGKV